MLMTSRIARWRHPSVLRCADSLADSDPQHFKIRQRAAHSIVL